jgi:outer membrane lipoprotein-sorting protein
MSDRCNEYREKIAGILAGDITDVDADAVQQHLLTCPECLRFHQELLKDDQLLTEFVRSADDEVARLEGLVMNTIDSLDINVPLQKDTTWWGARFFRNRAMKFVAAAAVIVAIIVGANVLNRPGGSGAVWADMMRQVEDAQDFICRIAQSNTADPRGDIEMVQYRSREYGLRSDIYRDNQLRAAVYIKPSSNIMYTIVYRDRTYALAELSDEQREQMLDESNARHLVQFFKSFDFQEIGRKNIDGVTASGIEVVNPKELAVVLEESTLRLWVDVETNWPVMIEIEGKASGGDVRIERTMYDFQWNPSLSKQDFEFEIPDDYKLLGRMEAPKNDQKSAIESLRAFAELTSGKYPSVLSYVTAIYEAEEGLRKQKRDGDMGQKFLDQYSQIGNACMFYSELLENDVDPAYYGEDVGPMDFDKVLLRWRLDDGRYRVVYGDLRTEDVSPERLAELEQK